jgi:hypothetical protein
LRTFNESVALDSKGFLYTMPEKIHELFAHDVDPSEANILAVVQKPFNQSIFAEKSGPRLGSSFQYGIRSLRTTILFHLTYNGIMQKE